MADGQTKPIKKHLSLVLRILIALLACWFLYEKINVAQVIDAFGRLHALTLFVAIASFCVSLCLIGFRWWVFMRAQKIDVPVFLAIKLTFLGQFFTNFMPSAVGGDLVRAWYISQHTPNRLQAAIGVGADRFVGLAGTALLAVSSYLLFMRNQTAFFQVDKKESALTAFFQNHRIPLYCVFLGGIVLLGLLFIVSDLFDLKGAIKKAVAFIIHFLQQVYQVFRIYIHHPMVLIFGLAVSVFMQVFVVSSFWLLGRNLGIEAPVQCYFVFFPMMWVVGALPLSIAGIGILEGGLVVLFVQFAGADAESVMALALCQRFVWIIVSSPGLLVHLTGSHRTTDIQC